MKIAILSDIKSNVYALQEVLNDVKVKNVDAILNLGDSFYGPIAPKQTYDLIREHQLINISGDWDRKILEASLEQLEENKTLNFVYNDLGEEVLYWIQDLSFEKLIGEDFYLIHGTYFNDEQYLLEDVSSGTSILRDDKKILELLDDIKSKFIFCGGSCLPRCVNLSSGQIIINPGSDGLQAFESEYPNYHKIENARPEASYIILNIEDDEFSVEPIRISYDYEKASHDAIKNSRPDWVRKIINGKV